MEHASVSVSLLNFRLFGMYYKARSNLRCVFIIIFVCLAFNRAKRIHHSPYYIVTGENIDALLKVKLNTVNIHKVLLIWNCDIRFIGTRSWVSRSKRELLKFPTWKKKKQSRIFIRCALHHSALSRLFKSFEFGNGSRMSDENLVMLEFKYLQNKKL